MGTLLRYPYEVRSESEYFDDIQDVKITKDMLDLASTRAAESKSFGRTSSRPLRYRADGLIQPQAQRRARRPPPRSRGPGTNVVDSDDCAAPEPR